PIHLRPSLQCERPFGHERPTTAPGVNYSKGQTMWCERRTSSCFAVMAWLSLLLSSALLLLPARALAFEADVHYGLTYWLALQAGFEPLQAQIIATGDQRVDSGDMPDIDVVALYACLAKDAISARRAGAHHYPSAAPLPGPPETRAVVADSSAARTAALKVLEVAPSQASYRLLQLGEALHTLQDSWAHQGVPGVPQLGGNGFTCDSGLAWGHPEARAGPASHRADLTMYWPADTVAMAQATYEILTHYPPIAGTQRNARNWNEVRRELDDFIKASSKTEKARWFAAHAMSDVSFLEGISLPDGAEAFLLHWPGRKLPPLSTPESRQHAIDAGLLDFYNRFFAHWLDTDDFAGLVTEFSVVPDANGDKAAAIMSRDEIESRLKLWRLRDHGAVADLALKREPLTPQERASIDAMAKQPNAYARYEPIASAYYPLLPYGGDVSPLLPYFIGMVSPAGGHPKAIAVTKFRHAPYNIVGIISENIDDQWRVTSIVSAVDH